jgi:hypothetical protein
MEKVPLHGDLQIDQDLAFSRREWRVQHIGWLLMVVLIAAASLGLFGRGPLSNAHVQTADGRLGIAYQRVAHHQASDLLGLDVRPNATGDDTVRVWFDRAYMQHRIVESISPEPERTATDGERIVYAFHLSDRTRPARIVFRTRPDALWVQPARAGIIGGDSLRYRQIVLP